MGRPRSFDEQHVVANATALFVSHGYDGTSIDDLVSGTGLHRGSLYKAFGSKRGIFLAALHRLVDEQLHPAASDDELLEGDRLDLLLVAALELAPQDDDVRELVRRGCALLGPSRLDDYPGGPALLLGRRLLHRAGA